MQDKYTFVITIFSIIGVSCITIALGVAWLRRPPRVASKDLAEIAERLTSLERAVDTIAVETERISEGQRFTTKLLSERSAEQSVPR